MTSPNNTSRSNTRAVGLETVMVTPFLFTLCGGKSTRQKLVGSVCAVADVAVADVAVPSETFIWDPATSQPQIAKGLSRWITMCEPNTLLTRSEVALRENALDLTCTEIFAYCISRTHHRFAHSTALQLAHCFSESQTKTSTSE